MPKQVQRSGNGQYKLPGQLSYEVHNMMQKHDPPLVFEWNGEEQGWVLRDDPASQKFLRRLVEFYGYEDTTGSV